MSRARHHASHHVGARHISLIQEFIEKRRVRVDRGLDVPDLQIELSLREHVSSVELTLEGVEPDAQLGMHCLDLEHVIAVLVDLVAKRVQGLCVVNQTEVDVFESIRYRGDAVCVAVDLFTEHICTVAGRHQTTEE
jgi:hypothetical protein